MEETESGQVICTHTHTHTVGVCIACLQLMSVQLMQKSVYGKDTWIAHVSVQTCANDEKKSFLFSLKTH